VSKPNSVVTEQTNPDGPGFPGDLLLELRPSAGGTKALQLTQGLRAAIVSGRLPGGTALPASRVLAAELGVSRSVVVQAFGDLIADGFLEARQGAGTRVRGDPDPGAHDDAEAVAFDGSLLRVRAPLRLLGGLPDPSLFPRTAWGRHYRAALTALPDPDLGYPDSRGAEPLRDALAAYLGRVRGVLTAPDRVLVCAGVTQGIVLICRALRRSGIEQIAVEDPCFQVHRDAIAATGLVPVPVPGDDDGLDPALLPGGAGAVLVAPAHSYPRGGTLTTPRRHALIDWARAHGGLVIEDDYDAELRYDRTPIAALQGRAPDHVAYVGSVSKTFSPALRLGWIAAPGRLVRSLEREKRLDDMGSSLVEQLALARVLDKGELARHLRRTRPVYRRRRDATIAALGRLLPAARRHGAAAGLHLYLELPGVDVRALRRAALARGVLVEDAALHWADPADAPPAIVLGYGSLPESAAAHAVGLLAAALAEVTRPGPATTRTRSARRPAAATSRAPGRA
jgi:GntR family transcriptional regulator / MocR family aminotransferase